MAPSLLTGAKTRPAKPRVPDATTRQTVGRMGELWVELQLLRNGWLVGNFNATTPNSKGWDLFAVKGDVCRKVRVKAATAWDPVWGGAGAKNAVPFPDSRPDDPDDWTIIVLDARSAQPVCFVVPTPKLSGILQRVRNKYHTILRKDGLARKQVGYWWLFFKGKPTPDGEHGYAETLSMYREAWNLLKASAVALTDSNHASGNAEPARRLGSGD